eukprot:m.85782 g.85782  ORF g.85782 m.85782 type:complete len:605 (+) comp12198_c0_seq11:880-2694(+)
MRSYPTLLSSLHRHGVSPENVEIHDVYATADGLSVTVKGRIVADVSSFLAPGQTLADITNNINEMLVFEIDENSGKDLSQITSVIRTVLAAAVLDGVESDIIAAMRREAGTCILCIQLVDAFASIAENYRDPTLLFLSICPITTSGATSCSSSSLSLLSFASLNKYGQTLSPSALVDLRDNIIAHVEDVPLHHANVLSFKIIMAELLTRQMSVDDARDNTLPQLVTLSSPSFAVGTIRPPIDLFLMAGRDNVAMVQEHLSQALTRTFFFDYIPPQSIQFDLVSRVLTDGAVGRQRRSQQHHQHARRRREDALLNDAIIDSVTTARSAIAGTHVVFSFKYETYCVPSALDTCRFTSADTIFSDVVRRVNTAIATFRVKTAHCFSLATSWSQRCLIDIATNAMQQSASTAVDVAELIATGSTAVFDLIGCGDLGAVANNSCFVVFPLAQHAANAIAQIAYHQHPLPLSTTAPAQTTNTDNEQQQLSSATIGVAVYAAIGGGVLLLLVLILLVLVLVKQRKGRHSKHAVETVTKRDVVAFENPMYTEPDGNYHDDDNLYEEPVLLFNRQRSKTPTTTHNPVYGETVCDSDDDIGEGEGEGLGYLDVK